MVDQWDDGDLYFFLVDECKMTDEIRSDVYRSLDSDGKPYGRPHREACERYDGPFDKGAPSSLHDAAGALLTRNTTFDPTDDDEFEDLVPDDEDRWVDVYHTAEDLEEAWNRTRHDYETGENRAF